MRARWNWKEWISIKEQIVDVLTKSEGKFESMLRYISSNREGENEKDIRLICWILSSLRCRKKEKMVRLIGAQVYMIKDFEGQT